MFNIFKGKTTRVLGIEISESHVSMALVSHQKYKTCLLDITHVSSFEHGELKRQPNVQRLIKKADHIAVCIGYEQVRLHQVDVPRGFSDEQKQLFFEQYLEKLGRLATSELYLDYLPMDESVHASQQDCITHLLCEADPKDIHARLAMFREHAIFPTMLDVEPYSLLRGVVTLLGDSSDSVNVAHRGILQLSKHSMTFIAENQTLPLFIRRLPLLPGIDAAETVMHVIRDYQLSTGNTCKSLVILQAPPVLSSFVARLEQRLDVTVVVPSDNTPSTFTLAKHIDKGELNQWIFRYALPIGLALGEHHP